jgi:proliferating cell nuclear antigen
LSFKVETIQKILKTLSNDEEVQMLVTPDSDVCLFKCYNKQLDRTSEYTVKLLELENEHLGVPDEAYPIEIQMPSGE